MVVVAAGSIAQTLELARAAHGHHAWREAVDTYQAIGASQEIAEVEAELDSLSG